MKLMVIIDGFGKPYEVGDIFKHRQITAVDPIQKTKKNNASPEELPTVTDHRHRSANQLYRQIQNPQNAQHRQIFLAKDIMSSPVTSCSPQQSLREVWTLLCEKRFRHLPVSPDGKKIIGIISDRDILKHAPPFDSNTTIRKIMTPRVLTSLPETNIRDLAKVFFKERVGCMPIINTQEEIQGIVTRSDILRTLTNHAPLELWG